MLYDNDDESLDIAKIQEQKLRKKAIICGSIVGICIIVMFVTIIFSIKQKNNQNIASSNEIKSETQVSPKKDNIYQGNHIQIQQHNLDEIKMKFMPKANPNAQEEIRNIYYSDEKVAYLTFDDGPSKNITPQILDILKQENVPATFFVLGSRVELNPDLVKREFEEGHYIANHGYTHEYSLIYRSKDTVFEEYIKCENAVRNALGNQQYQMFLFRFPGGSSGGRYASIKSEAKEMLNSYGIAHTNWNCLTGDAEGKTNPEELFAYFQATMAGDGSIIVLMHDASDKSYTVETLPMVISYLREQGYTFKNFYEIFR